MARLNKLTALQVSRLKEPGLYGDGGNLWLQVTTAHAKSWTFRYTMNGKRREMGLGPVSTVSLADARAKALVLRGLLLEGQDPIEERKAEHQARALEAAMRTTFEQCAGRYIEAHRAGWKNAKHIDQWTNTLRDYAFPVIGSLCVADVDTTLVLKVLEPIWFTKTETASRLRGRLEKILDWATVRGYRQGDNPARWKGHLEALLTAPGKVADAGHHDALPWKDAPAFMTQLRQMEGMGALALEFTILTAVRSGETRGARWSEIDIVDRVWTIPAERMKGKKNASREHAVPLCGRALEILQDLSGGSNDLIFNGRTAGKPLSDMSLSAVLRRMQIEATPHGFRSTFRDWASESTGHAHEVCEMALAHTINSKTEAAYRRGDLFEKRRALMQDWNDYLVMKL